jgi:hypothetical protein
MVLGKTSYKTHTRRPIVLGSTPQSCPNTTQFTLHYTTVAGGAGPNCSTDVISPAGLCCHSPDDGRPLVTERPTGRAGAVCKTGAPRVQVLHATLSRSFAHARLKMRPLVGYEVHTAVSQYDTDVSEGYTASVLRIAVCREEIGFDMKPSYTEASRHRANGNCRHKTTSKVNTAHSVETSVSACNSPR